MWKRQFATSRKALPLPSRACTGAGLSARLGQREGMSLELAAPGAADLQTACRRTLWRECAAVTSVELS